MTRFSPRTAPLRRAGGLAATALLLAAGPLTVAAAAPARAADPVFTLGGPAETALHPYAEGGGAPKRSTAGITVTNPADEGYEGGFTLTFDLTGVAGIADVTFDPGPGVECATKGTRSAVCTGDTLAPGLSTVTGLLLGAAKGSEQGASGTIRVTGEARGATSTPHAAPLTPFTTRVTVGGPDLVMRKLPFDHEPTPGQKQQAPITFANRGSRDADGVVLTLRYSRGLDIPQRYSNCAYTTDETWTTARCSVEGAFEAGATYTLAAPLTLEATTRAYRDLFVYGIQEAGTVPRAASAARSERGSGAVLRAVPLTKAVAARGVDLEPGDNEQEAEFRTANTADFVAYGDEASGAAGATVAVRLGFHNDGPAWIGRIRSGGSVAAVDFTVPQGATVTSAPKGCRGVTAEGAYREDRKTPAPRYVCPAPTTVRDGGGLDLSFGLRIDKALIGATGRVTVRGPGLEEAGLPFDPKPGNNTARVVLNGQSSGGPSPSPAPPAKGGPDAGSGKTPSAAPGTSGTGAPSITGRGGGSLASTGSPAALTASVTAIAALTTGLALFAAARRRRKA
ncbi:peptidase [Streptomyces microflavus]|uniref:peptidase n=1 Tax=Streptomyces microflavus TaxID=1919 RepID=UPI002DDC00BD|nr:peptidase [Streptomyces microflavus]WSA62768.1 peptidase [Streptomyces microflavus]